MYRIDESTPLFTTSLWGGSFLYRCFILNIMASSDPGKEWEVVLVRKI